MTHHRDLMRSAVKKRKLSFARLPEDLQDAIMDGLDSGRLTLEAARDMARAKGYGISHEAIARYHRAVRAERRLRDARDRVTRVIEQLSGDAVSLDDAVRALVRLTVAVAMQRIAEDGVEMRPVDLSKMLELAARLAPERKTHDDTTPRSEEAEKDRQKPNLTPDVLKYIKEQLYG